MEPPEVRRVGTAAGGGEGGERDERAEDVADPEVDASDFRFLEGYLDSSVEIGERGWCALVRLAAVDVEVVFRDLLVTGSGIISMLSKRGVSRSSKAPSTKPPMLSTSRFASSRGFIAGLIDDVKRADIIGLSKDSVLGKSGDKAALPVQFIQSADWGNWYVLRGKEVEVGDGTEPAPKSPRASSVKSAEI